MKHLEKILSEVLSATKRTRTAIMWSSMAVTGVLGVLGYSFWTAFAIGFALDFSANLVIATITFFQHRKLLLEKEAQEGLLQTLKRMSLDRPRRQVNKAKDCNAGQTGI